MQKEFRGKEFKNNVESLAEAFFRMAATSPETLVFEQAQLGHIPDTTVRSDPNPRLWTGLSYRECALQVSKIATYLQSLGIKKEDKVAILSNTRPEWMMADLGILSAGAVSVSIYQSLLVHDVGYILYDSGAQIVFAENQEQVGKLLPLLSEPCSIPATEDRAALQARLQLKRIISFERVSPHPLVISYAELLAETKPSSAGGAAGGSVPLKRHDMASLVYTSGTTGPPKGVIQTHGNHLANLRQVFQAGVVKEEQSLSLVLPLAHSFARLMGYIGFLTPVRIKFPAIVDRKSSRVERDSVTRDIREGGANVVPMVPRMLEKMKDAISMRAHSPTLMGKLLALTLWSARLVYQARHNKTPPPINARFGFALTSFLRRNIKGRLFGVNFQYAISGGAKLDLSVAQFFDSLGVPILEGYGLTETCVATNANPLHRVKLGTVGPVLTPDIEMKLAADGEIWFRGPNICCGYYQRPTATKAAWDEEGWFHTGDLGSLDSDGYLTIVGRKKELIKTSGGKYIVPNNLEEKIRSSPYVSQVVVIGEGRPYCVALITLNMDQVKVWGKNSQTAFPTTNLLKGPLYGEVWKDIEKVNSALASFETIKKVALLAEEFTVENSLLTPTLKVKRQAVEAKYRDLIESLYG